jgi:hypothetical protein
VAQGERSRLVVDLIILQTAIGAGVVVLVGVILLLRRRRLVLQGEDADPKALAAVENRLRILGIIAIFFVMWSWVRFNP